MFKMPKQDEALLTEVLNVLKNPLPADADQMIRNEIIISKFEKMLAESSEYSREKRKQAQAIVEAKRKIDPTYARSKTKKAK